MTDPSASDDLSALANTHLARQCAEEQKRYRLGLPSDDRYCLELYRRGIHQHDQEAWKLFQEEIAGAQVEIWLRQHRCFPRALTYAVTRENLVHLTFERFWQAVGPTKKEFSSLGKLFTYLMLCVDHTIQDILREMSKPSQELSLDLPAPSLDLSKNPSEEELWAFLKRIVKDERELLLLRLILIEGYKPGEIPPKFPKTFATKDEVYQLWRKIMDRLRRDNRVRRWLKKDEP